MTPEQISRAAAICDRIGWPEWSVPHILGPNRTRLRLRYDKSSQWTVEERDTISTSWLPYGYRGDFEAEAVLEKWLRERLAEQGIEVDHVDSYPTYLDALLSDAEAAQKEADRGTT